MPSPTPQGSGRPQRAGRPGGPPRGAKGKPAGGAKRPAAKKPDAKRIGPSRMPKRPVRRPAPAPADSAPREPGERLAKLLAAAGVASRRECESLVIEGRVMVDGVVETDLARRVDPYQNEVAFDGEPLPKRKRVYFAVNKPDGVVCTARDPAGRTRVTDLLPPEAGRVFNVGRLDMASEGLILLTNDGELANRLTHPRHGVQKVYHVKVAGVPTPDTLAQLRRGVYLAEGQAHFVDAKVKSTKKSGAILEVILDEGRNREIRRVLARVGHKVQRLTRVAVGPVRLAELPSGAYRPLTPDEVKALHRAAYAERSPEADAKKAEARSTHGTRPEASAPEPRPAHARKPFSGASSRSTGAGRPSTRTGEGAKPRYTKKPSGESPEPHSTTGKPRYSKKPIVDSATTPSVSDDKPRHANKPEYAKKAKYSKKSDTREQTDGETPEARSGGAGKPRFPKKPGGYASKDRPATGGKPRYSKKPSGDAPPTAPQRTIFGEVDPPAEAKPPRRLPSRKPAAPRTAGAAKGEGAEVPTGRPPRKTGSFTKRSGKPGVGKPKASAGKPSAGKAGKPSGGKPSGAGRPKGAKPKGRAKKRGAS